MTLLKGIGLKNMKVQYLPKNDNLTQLVLISDSTLPLEQYFIRYLSFQNKLVKKVKFGTNE